MVPLFQQLADLAGKVERCELAAKNKPPASPQAAQREAAYREFEAFGNRLAGDFRCMLSAACADPKALTELTRYIVNEIYDKFGFEGISAQANHASKKLQELRHEADALRNEVRALRDQVDRMVYRSEQKAA